MKHGWVASVCLLPLVGCARPAARCDASKETIVPGPVPARMPELYDPSDEGPRHFSPPEPILATIVDQLSRSEPVLQTEQAICTPAQAFEALKHLRPDRVYSCYTEYGGYFIFSDAQAGSSQKTGSPYPYGMAFKKGGTAVYGWSNWGPTYVSYIQKGATVTDDLVCILDLFERDWHVSFNGAIVPPGTSFHVGARIVNIAPNRPFRAWSEYEFLPHLELYHADSAEPLPLALTPSKDDGRGWRSDKVPTWVAVPDSAYGDYQSVLASLPPGKYRIIVSVDFTNGKLRSNPQEFTVAADR